eukprot:6529169-Alexandrium_andersonii.AAC.1
MSQASRTAASGVHPPSLAVWGPPDGGASREPDARLGHSGEGDEASASCRFLPRVPRTQTLLSRGRAPPPGPTKGRSRRTGGARGFVRAQFGQRLTFADKNIPGAANACSSLQRVAT